MPKVAGIRRFGSAATDLAWVASGRVDGYWDNGLSAWDIAAGVLIVEEAGGLVSGASGNDDMLASGAIVAGNEAIHAALLTSLKAASAG
jgi:myo-inositol-1(or 4)-monophosphatase